MPKTTIPLSAVFEKKTLMFFLMSLKFVKNKYKNVSPMVASRKSNIYHHPLHAKVNNPVKKPAIAVTSAIFSVFLSSMVDTNSHVISNGKKTTQTSLSGCSVLDRKAPLTASIAAAKKPPA